MKRVIDVMVLIGWMFLWQSNFAFAQGLSHGDANTIFAACQATANATLSTLRPKTGFSKMWCAVVDREGTLLLIKATDTGGTPENPLGSDAWRGSIKIAIAKAWTALAFSSNELALDSRTIGLLARLDVPTLGAPGPGTNTGPAPLFGIGNTNLYTGGDNVGQKHYGIVTFAGGQPVYSNPGKLLNCVSGGGILLGAVGVSGDQVDQDDAVAIGAVQRAGFCTKP